MCAHQYTYASVDVCISYKGHTPKIWLLAMLRKPHTVYRWECHEWMRLGRLWADEWLHETRTLPKQFMWCSPRTKYQPVTAESHSAYIYIYVHIHVHIHDGTDMPVAKTTLSKTRVVHIYVYMYILWYRHTCRESDTYHDSHSAYIDI